jgi:AmmeMemoRadiSam system protein A
LSSDGVAADERGSVLLAVAREALEEHLLDRPGRGRSEPWLRQPGASFVTLKKEGSLRGCIGTLRAYRPLGEDVRANAVAAATLDSRFPPLVAEELPTIRVEVSQLGALEPLTAQDEDDLLRILRPGIDGVVLEFEGRRGTFLPAVWDQCPDPRVFLQQLKLKAGLPAGLWEREMRWWRYGVERWREAEPERQPV